MMITKNKGKKVEQLDGSGFIITTFQKNGQDLHI